jgi:hypothetical protein
MTRTPFQSLQRELGIVSKNWVKGQPNTSRLQGFERLGQCALPFGEILEARQIIAGQVW